MTAPGATAQQLFERAESARNAGRVAEAQSLLRQILAFQADHADALHSLGILEFQSGRLQSALDLIQRAIQAGPTRSEFHCNAATMLASLGRAAEAIAALGRAIQLQPDNSDAYHNLGLILRSESRWTEAIDAFGRRVELTPGDVESRCNLADLLRVMNRFEEAITECRRAIAIDPNSYLAHIDLGNALNSSGDADGAMLAFRRAHELKPSAGEAPFNLGNVLKAEGQVEEAIAAYRLSLRLQPDFIPARSNLVLALHYSENQDAKSILREARLWDEIHGRPFRAEIRTHPNDRSPSRRLKIGYVSPEFRDHCDSFFTIPLLSNHDHERFDIYCYSSSTRQDAITERIRSYADAWREAGKWSDGRLAEVIRSDGIDILVDLEMHTRGGRQLLFARKPAPIQVAWLAYPGTTGLSAMDYRLSDPYLDPAGESDSAYSEISIRLPETFWCYDPLSAEPAVNALPALSSGRVTFGCLNNPCKLTDKTLRLWHEVLTAIPDSRLLFMRPAGQFRDVTQRKLQIPADRVEFTWYRPRRQYLETFHRIDIGLDTTPYTGHTTTLDSLWMGVPMVTLVGSTAVGRGTWSQLNNVNLKQFAARDEEEFVKIAVEQARDLQALANLRANLRERMKSSPLMDGPRFAGGVESAYRQMWRAYCQER
ncbi:MAG: tetratricopeptide repeat protein [Tepidisphaeraceae bacterium]|jgi:predicted O-linked N-acetylglucosamine transferase (SPINDLY family)